MAKLYFYYAAMNAGKSAILLQASHNYNERGMRTVMYCPRLDDRYGEGRITSRIGLQSDANIFDADLDLFVDVRKRHQEGKLACVLVDEAQFLQPSQVLQLTLVCDRLDIPVLCYGLRTDFRGEPFEGSKYLLAWAEELNGERLGGPWGSKSHQKSKKIRFRGTHRVLDRFLDVF